MTRRHESMTEKDIGKDRVATRFPVYKDVKKLWSYDYAAEEKKRFKGEAMWNPQGLDAAGVVEYLKVAAEFRKKEMPALTEEIALKVLVMNEYKVERTLKMLRDRQKSFEVYKVIAEMTAHEAKTEMIAFLHKLRE